MSDSQPILRDCKAGDLAPKMARFGLVVGVLGLLLGVVLGYGVGGEEVREHFWFAYLASYSWLLTLVLGTLLFSILMHLFGAYWSVTVRRLAEITHAGLPLVLLLGLPLLYPLVSHEVTVWQWTEFSHDGAAAEAFEGGALDDYAGGDEEDYYEVLEKEEHHHLVSHKLSYLNVPFLLGRIVLYVVVWLFLSRFFFRKSLAQDDAPDFEPTRSLRRFSAPAVILWALTLTFFAFDFLMSLDETWFSTMFGVYVFAGAFMANFAWLIVVARFLQSRGKLVGLITPEHYHDLGKLMFAFVCFWAYVGFSQFMLIWYANMPEETHWFQNRLVPAWSNWSVALMLGHFILPFVGILSRHVKRNPTLLAAWAGFLLVMHFVDHYWIVVPNLTRGMESAGNPFGWMDLALVVGMAGMLVFATARRAAGLPLVPIGDPNLKKALAFENA